MNEFEKTEQLLNMLQLNDRGKDFTARLNDAILLLMPQRMTDVENVAMQLDITPSRLRRYVLGFLGIPPARYIMFVRLRECTRLLKEDPLLSSAKISAMCGFYDNAHFHKTFVRYFGCTPLQYARKL